MENIVFDDKTEKELDGEELLDEDSLSAEEEAFIRGYSDEDEEVVCAECGIAIRGKSLTKEIDGEAHRFCSKECAQEFEESIG